MEDADGYKAKHGFSSLGLGNVLSPGTWLWIGGNTKEHRFSSLGLGNVLSPHTEHAVEAGAVLVFVPRFRECSFTASTSGL